MTETLLLATPLIANLFSEGGFDITVDHYEMPSGMNRYPIEDTTRVRLPAVPKDPEIPTLFGDRDCGVSLGVHGFTIVQQFHGGRPVGC